MNMNICKIHVHTHWLYEYSRHEWVRVIDQARHLFYRDHSWGAPIILYVEIMVLHMHIWPLLQIFCRHSLYNREYVSICANIAAHSGSTGCRIKKQRWNRIDEWSVSSFRNFVILGWRIWGYTSKFWTVYLPFFFTNLEADNSCICAWCVSMG